MKNAYWYSIILLCFGDTEIAIAFRSEIHSSRTSDSLSPSRLCLSSSSLNELRVAVVGAGPSGLLLSHRLLQAGADVSLFEKRSRPNELSQKAYALGIGIRGRNAIQSVDHNLWHAVQQRGFASERFILYAGPFAIKLRDGKDGGTAATDLEPSLLLFQSDLCRAMVDELDGRWGDSRRLRMFFDCDVKKLDFQSRELRTGTGETYPFDLVVGCDGVNSIVRKEIETSWSGFETVRQILPGIFKVVLLEKMPPLLDSTAVQLLFPSAGKVTAFVEPTAKGRCCVLFAGPSQDETLLLSTNATAIEEELIERFPKLEGANLKSAAEQLVARDKASQASVVSCNTYHYSSVAVLSGDAAHATGGVSGQGVNSALQDSKILAECLEELYNPQSLERSLNDALILYSQRSVPEGKALYDLSFGPKPNNALMKLRFAVKGLLDSLFKGSFGIGELPLQTLMTTSLVPFAEIRRNRNRFYDEDFPDEKEWSFTIAALDKDANQS